MDDILKRLLPSRQLKTTLLSRLQKKPHGLFFTYDKECDVLIVQFVPPDTETIIHYVDENVAVRYIYDSKEIVGFQVEAFRKSYLPKHPELRELWENVDRAQIHDLGEVFSISEQTKPKVADKVLDISRNSIAKEGIDVGTLHDSLIGAMAMS